MANLPAGSHALYRIMTEKSVIGFGKYADMRVGDILKVDPTYIAWAYFSCSMVSFKKEILEDVGITTAISKPGTSEEAFKEWKRKQSEGYTEEERQHYHYAHVRAQKGAALARLCDAKRATTFTKGQLQALNHGHKLNK